MCFGAVWDRPAEERHEGEGGHEEDPAEDELGVVEPASLLAYLLGAGRPRAHGAAAGQARAQVDRLLFLFLLLAAAASLARRRRAHRTSARRTRLLSITS